MIVGLICARAGSEGLPGKNLLTLDGVPLMGWAARKAREAGLEQLVVSTDYAKADLPFYAGDLRIIPRPKRLAGPQVSKWVVWQHVAPFYGPQAICVDIDVSRPLTTADDVRGAIECYLAHPEADHVLAVASARKSPYQDIYEPDADGFLHVSKRAAQTVTHRQDRPPSYWHGGITVIGPDALRHDTDLFDGRVMGYEIPWERCWDIDDATDYEIVQQLARIQWPSTQPAD